MEIRSGVFSPIANLASVCVCVCVAVGRSPMGLVHLGTWSVSLDKVLSLASPC